MNGIEQNFIVTELFKCQMSKHQWFTLSYILDEEVAVDELCSIVLVKAELVRIYS